MKRHTIVDRVGVMIPLVDTGFAGHARSLASDYLDDTARYLFVTGNVEGGQWTSLTALVLDVETARLERMTIDRPTDFGIERLELNVEPLDLEGVATMFRMAGRTADFDALRPRLSEHLPDAIAADGEVLSRTLATIEAAIGEATTEAGILLLRKAASHLAV